VAIKVDTFNFTLWPAARKGYQRLSGRTIERPQGAETSSSEKKGQELIYAALMSLDNTQMQVEDKTVNLSPGMAVTVEIKTGS
jgi:hemolysin D